jgi:hypothetical protein
VLRDDFISLFVRGCWLVSFFFTPIYMFVLVFLAMFGPKKGSIIAYISSWDFNFVKHTQSISYFLSKTQPTSLNHSLKYRFHFTAITSRSTSYFLFSFWLFFFFYGETLLLIVFNYSTPIDTITSSSFFTIKQHIIFFLTTTSTQLTSHINFYIYFLTSCSFMYLINLNYSYNYNYFKQSFFNSSFILTSCLFMYFIF